MIKILSLGTLPWPEAFSRRHRPPAADFSTYRPCLRWEFGFCCALCLLHESDIAACGATGWGIMSIEHLIPQSVAPERANDYLNCIYACGRCNRSRRNLQDLPSGARLLNPC